MAWWTVYKKRVAKQIVSGKYLKKTPEFRGDAALWDARPRLIPWSSLEVNKPYKFPINPNVNFWEQYPRLLFYRHREQSRRFPKKFKVTARGDWFYIERTA